LLCLRRDASHLPVGDYKVVLDYSMAAAIAHEAFGHAAEADNRRSVLFRDGRYCKSMRVGPPFLRIVDESIPDDYGFQPFSSNGTERKKVTIVEGGIVRAGLSDPFSAARCGMEYTGSERVASYGNIPIPRMSNIRLEVDGSPTMNLDYEDLSPEELYEVLRSHGLCTSDERVILLTGHVGGQANPATGDFVFRCQAVFDLTDRGKLYLPSSLSGNTLSILHSIEGAVGPVRLDAQTSCFKRGQSVHCSGGSNRFVVVARNKQIVVGGK